MDYKEKYEMALETVQEILDSGEDFIKMSRLKLMLQSVFHELKESEDERIKKDLIGFFKDGEFLYHKKEEIVEWLEKQGEEKSIDMSIKEKAHQIAWETSKHYDPLLSKESWCEMAALDMASWLEKQGDKDKPTYSTCSKDVQLTQEEYNKKRASDEATIKEVEAYKKGLEDAQKIFEKQSEQRPTDKIEPKFKVGDWINGYYTNYKVLSVNNKGYVVEDVYGNKINILFENEKFHHLWTIQDAKEGDVLVDEDVNVIGIFEDIEGMCWHSKFYYSNTTKEFYGIECGGSHQKDFAKPATKEQRDLLFQKMKEAGYEWDAEKKELKIKLKEPDGYDDNIKWSDTDKLLMRLDKIVDCNIDQTKCLNNIFDKLNEIS